jgi:acyl carrier protein
MTTDELLALFTEAIEAEPGTLTPETRIADVPEWNSLGWLTIMSELDDRLGIQIGSRDIQGFRTVQDVLAYVGAKTTIAR